MNIFLLKIINTSCLIYTISSFILNFLPWLFSKKSQSTMLTIWANLIILIISVIVSVIIEYKLRKKEKNTSSLLKLVFLCSIIYTLSSYLLNITQYIIQKENFWNGYTLLILLLFSSVASFSIEKIKFKSYLVSSIFNFILIGIFYYIFYVVKAKFNEGNSALVSLGIYCGIYITSAIVYYLIVRKKKNQENSEKSYKNLFS